jgi:hypothetical protein
MALTESKLRQIIREDAAKMMREAPHGRFGGMYDDKKFGDQFRDDHDDGDYLDGPFDPDTDEEHDARKDRDAELGHRMSRRGRHR